MMKILISAFFVFSFFVSSSQEIRVMTYNIRFDNPGDGVNAWPNRKANVFALLRKYDPHVIGLQEALKHQIEDILDALPEYAYFGAGRDDGHTKGEYSAVLYKRADFEVLDPETFWLSETPSVPGSKSWDAAITRVVSWAKFRFKNSKREFLLFNTHFDHIGQEARKNSAQILRKRVNDAPSLPVIITGDFNCMRNEEPYSVMMAKDGISLVDPAPKNPPGTFCSFEVNSVECRGIDYIFHTPQWKSSKYKVITDNDGKHYPSDHLPVMVSVRLR